MSEREWSNRDPDCPFCNYAGPTLRDYDNVIVFEPLNPVTPGHVLVVPKAHTPDVSEWPWLSAVVMAAVSNYIHETEIGDCNIITSKGKAATQTVFHLHVHIVPRREGDGLMLPWSAA